MSLPNGHGVYTEGLEILKFIGRHSNMEISFVHCEDGLWRYGLSGEFMESREGFSFLPHISMSGCCNREDCIREACTEIRQKIKNKANENPLASKELTAWVNSLLYESRQLSLF